MKFSAVIVTRGDVDLGPALAPILPLADEIVIRRGHGGVFERWEAILAAKHDLVYSQDDDAVVDVEAMMVCAAPAATGQALVCNMPADRRPEYQDGTALVGWGAFVPKAVALVALIRYRSHFDADELYRRETDRIVTGLSPLQLVDVPFFHLPWANGPGRMCAAAGDPVHAAARAEIRKRIEAVRLAEAISPDQRRCPEDASDVSWPWDGVTWPWCKKCGRSVGFRPVPAQPCDCDYARIEAEDRER